MAGLREWQVFIKWCGRELVSMGHGFGPAYPCSVGWSPVVGRENSVVRKVPRVSNSPVRGFGRIQVKGSKGVRIR